jgi:hypothetical protein
MSFLVAAAFFCSGAWKLWAARVCGDKKVAVLYIQLCYGLRESQTIAANLRIEAVKQSARRRDNDNTLVFIAASCTTFAQLIAGLFQRSFSTFAASSMDTAALIALKSIDDIAALLFVRS